MAGHSAQSLELEVRYANEQKGLPELGAQGRRTFLLSQLSVSSQDRLPSGVLGGSPAIG